MNKFDKFYKKTREERLEILKENRNISESSYKYLLENKVLTNEKAKTMIENQIGIYSLPLGIATNFLINGKEYVIPMVTEEPSVIAAASNAAKIMKNNGGIISKIDKRMVIGQIAYYDFDVSKLELPKEEILKLANLSKPDLVSIGGGAVDFYTEIKDEFFVCYLVVDTVDAMGANMVNTMLESIAPYISDCINGTRLMSILSNYSTSSVVKASCKLKIEEEEARRIEKAYLFACSDIYRAVTNNKGVLNGVDAVAIATGNDFRAVEASIHSYAMRSGKYQPLASWKYVDGYLVGEIKLALPIATVGGSISLNDTARISLEILNNPNAKELSEIIASVGLAQNFAAIKALVGSGIQKGHMKLHAKGVALIAGADDSNIDKVVDKLMESKSIDIITAKKILEEL